MPSDITDKYSDDDIEAALDCVAEEIEASSDECLIPLYQWLEEQLEIRRRRASTMDSVRARLERKRGV